MCVSNSVCQLFCLIPATQIEVQSNRIFDKIISYTVRDVPFSLNKIYVIFFGFFPIRIIFLSIFHLKTINGFNGLVHYRRIVHESAIKSYNRPTLAKL